MSQALERARARSGAGSHRLPSPILRDRVALTVAAGAVLTAVAAANGDIPLSALSASADPDTAPPAGAETRLGIGGADSDTLTMAPHQVLISSDEEPSQLPSLVKAERINAERVAREEAARAEAARAEAAAREQAARDEAARAAREAEARRPLFVRPAAGTLTSGYGMRSGTMHWGIDIANRIGTPILAAADGVVIESGPASGFGLWVRLRHADGTVTIYGHIDRSLVRAGQQVKAGQQIATMGNRGQSTGPHLHFEVWNPSGAKINPLTWLRAKGVQI